MKKIYSSFVFIAAFLAGKAAIAALYANAAGFATPEVSGAFSVTCLSTFVITVIATTAYKLTPRI